MLSTSASSSSVGLPPLPLPSTNPTIAADSSSYYSTYDPSYGNFGSSSDGLQHDAEQSFSTSSTSNANTTVTGKRKNLKRDNDSVEVEALQARVAELEAKLHAAAVSSSSLYSGSQGSLGTESTIPYNGSSNLQPHHVHFQLQDDPLPPHLQELVSNGGSRVASSNASSTEMIGGAAGSRSNTTSQQGTTSISPFSSNGLPTPPTSVTTATASGNFPPSPASNGSRGSGKQDASQLHPQGQQYSNQQYQAQLPQQQQQQNTTYFTRSPLGQQPDAKWDMAALPKYLNMTPPGSQPQSPYGSANLASNKQCTI